MKIILAGNAPFTVSAYGQQMKHHARAFRDLGHEIVIVANGGLMGNTSIGFEGIPVHNEAFCAIDRQFVLQKADIVIALYDIFANELKWIRDTRFIPYFPVDCEPIPTRFKRNIEASYDLLTYSAHGADLYTQSGYPATYIPLVFDENEYFVEESKAEARARYGFPAEGRLFGIVADNNSYPSRKAYPQQITAFAEYLRHDPTAKLYIHGSLSRVRQGVGIAELIELLGIQQSVYPVDQDRYHTGTLEAGYMRGIYNAIDCLLSVSSSEGFCLPLIEAQACGTPVITSDWLCMSENFFSGRLVKKADAEIWYNSYGAWQYMPHIKAIRDAIFTFSAADYNLSCKPEARRELSAAVRHYEIKNVIQKYWVPKFTEIEKRIAAEAAGG